MRLVVLISSLALVKKIEDLDSRKVHISQAFKGAEWADESVASTPWKKYL